MVERERLPNGLTFVFEDVPGVRSASVGVWLRIGSRHEPPRLSGACHFVEHMLFKGTETRSAREISLLSDRIGGNLDAFTTKETTCFYARALEEHLPLAVDLLADIVRRPRFDAEETERERKVILEEIRMVNDSPEERIYDLFCERFWPDHPLGRPIQGTEETVGGLSRRAVLGWFRRAYVPGNIVVAAAGRLGARRRAAIKRAFADLPKGTPARRGGTPRFEPGIAVERRREMEQTQLLLGVPSLPAGDKRRFALHVLNTLLGGSLSSRLFQRIREERGLAYSVGSQTQSFDRAGLFTVYAGVSPENAAKVVRLALGEMRDLAERAPSAEEVDLARDHLKGNMLLSLESTSSRMSRAAREEMTLGRSVTVREMSDALDAVGPRQVRDLAERLFAGQSAALAVCGRVGRLGLRGKDLEL
ncbi:MAG: pitrilysin family protein [Candidatus Polarisedimenticolia bacterium]|nr:insulinase family protein [bacterium]